MKKSICNFIIALTLMAPVVLYDVLDYDSSIFSATRNVLLSKKFIIVSIIAVLYLIVSNCTGIISNFKNNKKFIFSLTGFIGFAISYISIILDELDYICLIDLDNIENIEMVIFVIGYAIMCIEMVANLILLFKNKDEKSIVKRIIWSVLFLIYMIVNIILFINKEVLVTYLLAILAIMVINIAMIIKQDKEVVSNKIIKVLNIINIIIVIGILGITCQFFIQNYNNSKKVNMFIDNLNTKLKTISSNQTPMIPAGKDGKYGYIDPNGNKIIDFEYDWVSEPDINIETMQFLGIGEKDNEYYLLSNTGEVISNLSNDLVPYKSGRTIDGTREADIDNIDTVLFQSTKIMKVSQCPIEKISKYTLENEDKYIYLDDYEENKLVLDQKNGIYIKYKDNEESKDEIRYTYNLNYDLSIYKNGELLDQVKDVEIGEYRYTNGSIPFCNIDNKVQGWIEKSGEVKKLDGEYCILDVTDDYIVVKNYQNDCSMIMDKNGKVKLKALDIHILNNGYVVKNYTEKYAYISKDLTSATDYYDIIGQMFNDVIAINVDKDGNGYKAYLLDKKGNKITNEEYDALAYVKACDIEIKHDGEYTKLIIEDEEEENRIQNFEDDYEFAYVDDEFESGKEDEADTDESEIPTGKLATNASDEN